MVQGPKETIVAAASRFIDGFRVSAVSRHRHLATKKLVFPWYILEEDLADVIRRFSMMLTPEVSDRIGDMA